MWTSKSPFNQSPPQPLEYIQWKHDQPRAYYESRGNGATEKKGAQICTCNLYNVRNLDDVGLVCRFLPLSVWKLSKFCFLIVVKRHQIDDD
jgi:hypothetical protein